VRCFRAAGLLTLLWLALLPASGRAAELVPLPTLKARVTDLTASLDATQRGRLEAQLAAFDRTGRAQIAVLMLPTTRPETIEQFGIRLAEAWKIGHKDADNGIIVIVAKDDRKMRIEVGYGLEGSIPDAMAKRIIAERMAPLFKQGDFFGGLFAAALESLAHVLGGRQRGDRRCRRSADPRRVEMAGYTSGESSGLDFLAVRHRRRRPGCCVCCSVCSARWRRRRRRLARFHGVRFAGLRHRCRAVLIFLLSFVKLFSGGGGGFGGGSSAAASPAADFRAAAAASAAAALRGIGEMKLARMFRHLLLPDVVRAARVFARDDLAAIGDAIAACEKSHRGELRFVVEGPLPVSVLWHDHIATGAGRRTCSPASACGTRRKTPAS
jgi:uncharacterized membrane protein YgcG